MQRRRLDTELVRRKLVSSRTEGSEAIAAGSVTVNGAPIGKPSSMVLPSDAIAIIGSARRFVSRGGDKLDHAIDRFVVDVAGRHCLDAGISTGGFTDALLQRGAAHVIGFDVGYGQVHERIRTDPRVDIRERTNIRHVTADAIPVPTPSLLVADLSFISLALVIPAMLTLIDDESGHSAEAVVLVKPQFEAKRQDVGKGGIVRDPMVWRASLGRVARAVHRAGWRTVAVTPSPITGTSGNVEFLMHLRRASASESGDDAMPTTGSVGELAPQLGEAITRAVAQVSDSDMTGSD